MSSWLVQGRSQTLRMIKKLLLFFFFILILIHPTIASADSNFSTTFNVTYAVHETGVTHVNFVIQIKNVQDTYYASSYTLRMGFSDIEHIIASDPDGSITPDVQRTDSGQELTFHFNKHVAGKGSILPLYFSFDTTDVASQNGQIWEVNIPGLSNQNDFSNFTATVSVPPSFGKESYIKADIGKGLTFTKDALGKSGISLAFGDRQSYHYSLVYHLKNSNLFPIQTEIALPPSTSYQIVTLESLTPKPVQVVEDKDGNWLAKYALFPSQKLDVTASGRVLLSLTPTSQPLSDDDKKIYLQYQQYWEITNPQIQKLAESLKTPEAIYNYVVNTLQYDFSRVNTTQERLGAEIVLAKPTSAVCLEFTDLFIALSRAAGIPAREVDGYAYTKNTRERPLSLVKDILHAWPEYYNSQKQEWIMVDPTWGNTTGGVDYFHALDFDHISFVIKGEKSTYPVPAGGYKLPGEENLKDVDISFSPDATIPNPDFSFQETLPGSFIAGLPILDSVIIHNRGQVAIPPQQLTVTTDHLTPSSQIIETTAIPPLGTSSFLVGFDKTPFLTNTTDTVRIQFAGSVFAQSVHIYPFSVKILLIGGGILLAILTITIFIITLRSRRLSIF